MELPDLTNKRFRKLLVIKEIVHKRKNGGRLWLCQCDCGSLVERTTGELNAMRRCSCGCRRSNSNGGWSRGKRTRLYITWCNMIDRCYNTNSANYKNYGGRGINLCDEWRGDFERFANWALNNGYTDSLTIDRIDVNGNYEPSNCRWATPKQQSRNKRNNHLLTFNGYTCPITEWSEKLGIKNTTIHERLRRGWSIEKTLSTPIRRCE